MSGGRASPAGAMTTRRSRPVARVAWLHPEDLDYAGRVAAGRRLGEIGRGTQWWIGDWLQFGIARFGERYVEASRLTGYDPKSLRNMRYVASRFDASLRRDNLEWSHHALLAPLPPDDQAYWLERATADRLSVDDLREDVPFAVELGGGGPGGCVSGDGIAVTSSVVV